MSKFENISFLESKSVFEVISIFGNISIFEIIIRNRKIIL